MSAGWTGDERDADLYATALESLLGSAEEGPYEGAGQGAFRSAAAEAAEHLTLVAAALTPIAPSRSVKARFLRTIRQPEAPSKAKTGAVRADEGEWQPTGVEGVAYKPLYVDRTTGLITMLVRMAPGAVYPSHRHSKVEQCLLLEGDVTQAGQVYGPGDFTWAEAGSDHSEMRTEGGNLLLIIAAASTGEI